MRFKFKKTRRLLNTVKLYASFARETGVKAVPSSAMRYRVHGTYDLLSFLQVGRQCRNDIITALGKIGKGLDSFHSILDFGCGCGRTLTWLARRLGSSQLYGTDIDAEAVTWCRKNLKFTKCDINNALPPLRYPSGSFDLIYAISVFSHINSGLYPGGDQQSPGPGGFTEYLAEEAAMTEKKLLIIDDEKDFVDTLTTRLEAKGYQVIEAYDGPDGLEKARSTKPDLIILDIMMPGMSGFDVCLKLKDDKNYSAIPIIMLTAKFQPNDIEFGKEVGADAYLTKPIELEVLLQKIRELLPISKS